MNPVGLALSAANPGLLPLAFGVGGGGYDSEPEGCGWVTLAAVVVLIALYALLVFVIGGAVLIISAGILVAGLGIGASFHLGLKMDGLLSGLAITLAGSATSIVGGVVVAVLIARALA